MEIEHLAGLLARELNVDIPGLRSVVLEAVSEAHSSCDNPMMRAERVAVGIVDGLAYRGTPIEDYLEKRSAWVWEGAIRQRYLKALRRASPLGVLN